MTNSKSSLLKIALAGSVAFLSSPVGAADVHVVTGKCVTQEREEVAFLAAIGTALLSSLIQTGANFLGSKISDSAKAKTQEQFANTNFVADAKDHPICFQVVRGEVDEDIDHATTPATGSDLEFAAWAKSRLGVDDAGLDRLRQNGLRVVGVPDFFFEGYFRPAASDAKVQPAYAVVPLASAFNQPVFGAKGTRGITVTTALFAVGDDPAKAPSALFDLGRRKPGSVASRTVPTHKRSFSSDSQKEQLYPALGESQWIPTPFAETRRPMTLRVRVSETRDARAFLQFVSDVYSGAKEGLVSAVKGELIAPTPEARATNLTNQADLANKVLAARNALQTFCAARVDSTVTPADRYAKGIAAQSAVLTMQAAAAKLETNAPLSVVPGMDVTSLDATNAAAACAQVGIS
jgi:hypothetical protein